MNNATALATFLTAHPRLTILTGAGISTNSGIPDYRDRDGNWKHARPMQYAEFTGTPRGRQRYWARSLAGWRRMSGARPNGAHLALAKLEARGRIDTLVTQNVDGLHSRAGSERVVDLHGRLDRVICIDCGWTEGRALWQARLEQANPDWKQTTVALKPDGDAQLADEDTERFIVPDCPGCAGFVKPDVVFFGENVPKDRVRAGFAALERSDALLVIGTSLMVYSGFRFPRRAHELGKPVAILNRGRTRADDIATLCLDEDCDALLNEALQLLEESRIHADIRPRA